MASVVKKRAVVRGLFIELTTLVLSNLPVKSLLRFKLVSKEWDSLISSTYFINLHLDNHPSDNRFLIAKISGNRCGLEKRGLDSNLTVTNNFLLPKEFNNKEHNYVDVVASCRGLVVLELHYDSGVDQSELVMWNPSTNNYMLLPSVHFPDSRYRIPDYGFGYDKLTDDYKLVMFSYVFDEEEDEEHSKSYSQHVYSAKRNSWGLPLVVNTGYMNHLTTDPAVVDDHILHWLFWNQRDRSMIELRGFDICTEKWLNESLPFPPRVVETQYGVSNSLGVLDNCLCLVSRDHQNKREHVWAMKEHGVKESWTKLLSVDMGRDNLKCISDPLLACSGEELLVKRYDGKYYWYNAKDSSVRSTGLCNCESLTLCAESLVPVPFAKKME